MAAEFEIDFDRAQATRASLVGELGGQVDSDVARVLARADSPDWFLVRPPEIVSSWADLGGPHGAVDVPQAWRAGLPARVDREEERVRLYAQVLVSGSSADQAELLHPQWLIDTWSAIVALLPPPLVDLWQGRFPRLRS